MPATLLIFVAVLLWASLATLAVQLAHVPPFFLTGAGLLIGSLVGLVAVRGDVRQWRVSFRALLLGVYGLFGFHFCLFMALRLSPPVATNLINYLWPLFIVVLTPALIPQTRFTSKMLFAALLGFAGAALAVIAGSGVGLSGLLATTPSTYQGYGLALCSALIWASYSLLSKRWPTPTGAIGLYGLVSGALSMLCSVFLENFSIATLSATDWILLCLIGAGPLGLAFYAWDLALKKTDARRVGVFAFATPILSTLLLSLSQGLAQSPLIGLAALLIVLASHLASGSENA